MACNSYRNPALLAKILSTLDVICNGRTELRICAGWHEDEYSAYGYVYPLAKTRIKQLDEALSMIKAKWTARRTAQVESTT